MPDDEQPATFEAPGSSADRTAGPASSTPLDALRAETKREVRLPSEDLSVPERPGWGMRFDPNRVDGDKMKRWAENAVPTGNRRQRRARGGEVDITEADQMKFAKSVLRATHEAFLWQAPDGEDWQVVVKENGDTLSLNDDEFLDMVGAATPDAALTLWYVSEGHLLQAAGEVVDAAGFGEGDVNPLAAQ